jgi:hypothetical protein
MSKHSVEVKQLSTWGGAFVNVNGELDGQLELWGHCYQQPTFLLQNGSHWVLITFDNQIYADAWMNENKEKYQKITEILSSQ